MTAAFLCGCRAVQMGGTGLTPLPAVTSAAATWKSSPITWKTVARVVGDMLVGASAILGCIDAATGTVLVSTDFAQTFTETTVTGAGTSNLAVGGYGNGLFMLVGSHSFTSPDGVNWTQGGAVPFPGAQQQPTWFGGKNWFLSSATTGWGGNNAVSNDNGATWTSVAPPAGYFGRGEYGGAVYDGAQLVWIPKNSTTNHQAIATSVDGINWSVTEFTNQAGQWLLAYADGVYACASGTGGFVATAASPAALAAATFTSPTGVGVWSGLAVTADGRTVGVSSGPAALTLVNGGSWVKDTTSAFSSVLGFGRIGVLGGTGAVSQFASLIGVRAPTCGC